MNPLFFIRHLSHFDFTDRANTLASFQYCRSGSFDAFCSSTHFGTLRMIICSFFLFTNQNINGDVPGLTSTNHCDDCMVFYFLYLCNFLLILQEIESEGSIRPNKKLLLAVF